MANVETCSCPKGAARDHGKAAGSWGHHVGVIREREAEEGTADQVLGDIECTSIGNQDMFIFLLIWTFSVKKSVNLRQYF